MNNKSYIYLSPSLKLSATYIYSYVSIMYLCVFYVYVRSVFLKKKHVFFLKTLLKKNKGQNVFFLKPPVFKVNIHNLSQFVNHTVIIVQNKNNNERISLK